MLTQVLLRHMLRTAAVIVGVGAALGFLFGGFELAGAIALGGILVGGSGALQIWLVGILFDPDQGTPQKLVVGVLLMLKLLFVGVILWAALTRWNPHQVGLLIGMGLGLVSLVAGVSRGSTSREGLDAMEAEERKIAEKMGDTEEEKR